MTSVEISALRARLGMTTEQMAECIGVERMTLYRWEAGNDIPRRKRAKRLKRLAYLADHLLARRSKPDWTL